MAKDLDLAAAQSIFKRQRLVGDDLANERGGGAGRQNGLPVLPVDGRFHHSIVLSIGVDVAARDGELDVAFRPVSGVEGFAGGGAQLLPALTIVGRSGLDQKSVCQSQLVAAPAVLAELICSQSETGGE